MAKRKPRNFLVIRNRILVFITAFLLLAAGALAIKALNQSTKSGAGSGGSYVNLNPPTEEEKQQPEARKDELGQPSSPPPVPTPSGKKAVTPIITNASQEQINTYVPGIFEEGGTCKATLTKGSKTVTKTSAGFENVSYTSCTPMNLSGSLTEKGTWSLVVSYSSASAEGKSAATLVEVR